MRYAGKILVFFGDSVLAGAMLPSPTTQRYSTLLCARLGATELNHARSGSTLETGLGRESFPLDQVPTYGAGYGGLVLGYGINDIDNGGTVAGFGAALDAAVAGIGAKGWPASDIILLSPYYFISNTSVPIQPWVDASHAAALRNGCKWVDMYTPVLNDPSRDTYRDDTYHPNPVGSVVYANIAYAALTPAPLIGYGRPLVLAS
jgi:lysophospholipase L1-like esterase